MKDKKQQPLWMRTGHRKPVTRREFLASGSLPFLALGVGPSLLSLFSQSASAADCGGEVTTALIPFITVNLNGGAGLCANVLPKTISGDVLSSYSRLGLGSGPGKSFNIEKEFGNVEFPGTVGTGTRLVSQFLDGVRRPRSGMTANTAALAKTAFVWSASRSADDSSDNPLDISGLVLKLGLKGISLPNLGVVSSDTGIEQRAALMPPPQPFIVSDLGALTSSLGYSSALADLTIKQKSAMARAISQLSNEQMRKLGQLTGFEATKQIIECSGIRNLDLMNSTKNTVDPFLQIDVVGGKQINQEVARIWSVDLNNVDASSENVVNAAMTYNSLMGNASTVSLNLGGYDYHDSTRSTGDAADRAAGQLIGNILEMAEYLQKPVFIYVCSDGSVVSADSATANSPWSSDRGLSGMQFILTYDPKGRPITSGSQIGGFDQGQSADESLVTGASPEMAAAGIFANYAALNKKMDFLETNNILGDAATRKQVIKFSAD